MTDDQTLREMFAKLGDLARICKSIGDCCMSKEMTRLWNDYAEACHDSAKIIVELRQIIDVNYS